ncbi:MAG: type IX secretion system protein PorQ [Bacteroidales bacterium]
MIKKILNILILSFFIVTNVIAQTGGTSTYKFINSLISPRLSGMGVDFTSIYENDLNLVVTNPSLINPEMHTDISLSYIDYLADVNMGYLSYSHTFNKVGSFALTMQYVNYDKFIYADEAGVTGGEFTCNDLALTTGWGRQLTPNWSIGANLKMFYSMLEAYKSFGLAVDIAGTYRNTQKNLDVSLAARNIGAELKSYAGNRSKLPFEIQLAISQKVKHLPFRYVILFQDLQKWNLSNYDVNSPYAPVNTETNAPIKKSNAAIFGDNLLRHIAIGGEFTIANIVNLRLGYNYQRGKELRIEEIKSLAGFSFGLGVNIYKFEIDYSHSIYAVGRGPNYFSIKTKLSNWF